jgi:hypothetical protein
MRCGEGALVEKKGRGRGLGWRSHANSRRSLAWTQPGSEGGFEFAFAPDGQSFVGRSDHGEYWNGERFDDARVAAAGFGTDTPCTALISLLSAANAATHVSLFECYAEQRIKFKT